MPKKVEKKDPVPETEPSSSEEPSFKLPKKKPSVQKQLPKEEPKEEESPFGKIKLKKAERVQRTWEDDSLEKVDLKHHEFERPPQDEEVLGHPLFICNLFLMQNFQIFLIPFVAWG